MPVNRLAEDEKGVRPSRRRPRQGLDWVALNQSPRASRRSPPGFAASSRSIRMCGIIAYVGRKVVQPLLIEGLKRLEYRGYDSAGVAVIDGKGQLHVRRAVGRISVLENAVTQNPL